MIFGRTGHLQVHFTALLQCEAVFCVRLVALLHKRNWRACRWTELECVKVGGDMQLLALVLRESVNVAYSMCGEMWVRRGRLWARQRQLLLDEGLFDEVRGRIACLLCVHLRILHRSF